MKIQEQIASYIASQPEPKRDDMEGLHRMLLRVSPGCKLWFLDGKNSDGKTVSNPNVGYGSRTIKYADAKTREFYQVGMSANTTGISIYILDSWHRGQDIPGPNIWESAGKGERERVLH